MLSSSKLEGEAREYVERRNRERADAEYEDNRVTKAAAKVLDWLEDDTVVSCVPPEQSRRDSMRPQHGCRCSSGSLGEVQAYASKLDAYRKKPGVAGVQGGHVAGLGASYWVVCGQKTADEASVGRKATRRAREEDLKSEQAREGYKRQEEATGAYLMSEKGREDKEEAMKKIRKDLEKMGVHVSGGDHNNNANVK